MIAGFMGALERVNALADGAPGFIWRLQTEAGDATSLRVGDDDLMLLNMSVWESIEALWTYVYASGHLDVMRRRREWFEAPAQAHLVLWWRPAGPPPTIDEAIDRLGLLRERGPTPQAFSFRTPFSSDGRPSRPASRGGV